MGINRKEIRLVSSCPGTRMGMINEYHFVSKIKDKRKTQQNFDDVMNHELDA